MIGGCQMQVINNELVVHFDIDKTLIKVDELQPLDIDSKYLTSDIVKRICPYTGVDKWIVPHKLHVKYLIEHKARGYTVFVWSNAGHRHAESVIKALGLEQYVDYVMNKPGKVFDDQPLNEMCARVYLNEV
jgi:phosphoglycolate phosphatase-like HAD superfamily hydrolase